MLESLVPLVDQELPTLPEYLHLPPGFGEVRVAQSVVFCIVFSRALFVRWPIVSFPTLSYGF